MDIGTVQKTPCADIKERYNSRIRESGRVTKSNDAVFERKRSRRALEMHIIL